MAIVAAMPALAQMGGMGMEGFSKSEYRYWNFVLGLSHGFGGTMGKPSESLMLRTYDGDMPLEKKGFTYTPGVHVGIVYNYDLPNNRMGLVAGLEVTYYGVQNKYVSTIGKYDLKDTYRAIGVTIPYLFKFSGADIYRDMKYICIGIKPTMNFSVKHKQKSSWASENYGGQVDGKKALSVAATMGFNYNILSVNLNYMFMEFVDSKLDATQDFKGHIFLCTSLNLPMTRWLCIHNWTAEKIRRKIKGKGGM